MPRIRVLQELTHPRLDVRDLRERIPNRLLAGIQLGEAHTETELVNIRIDDDVVVLADGGWINQ